MNTLRSHHYQKPEATEPKDSGPLYYVDSPTGLSDPNFARLKINNRIYFKPLPIARVLARFWGGSVTTNSTTT